jgi:putative MATE family efflux protein
MPQPAANSEKFIRFTTAPVAPLICSQALPSIAIMIVSSLYNMADTYFVGSLGTSQVAAVGIAFPLMTIVQAMGFFFGQGSANYMSRALGAQDREGAARMAATGFFSGFLCMAALAAIGIVFLTPLVIGLGATPTIAPYVKEYLFFILLASPWMVIATVLNQQLRFQGSANIAMIGMITGAVLNIFLDPLFIFVFNMGVKGAAVATMLSQIVSFLILFLFSTRIGENIPIQFKNFSPSIRIYYEMFKGGIPALLRQALTSISAIILNHFAGAYGDAAIAAISIVNRIYMFASSVMLGFGQGFQPVCGFNYGAKLYHRVKSGFWFCVRLMFVGLLVMAVVMAILAPRVVALFRKEDLEVIRIGALGLRLHCISLPFTSFIIISTMMTQTMGKALYSSIISISRQGLFLIPLLLIFTLIGGFGLMGLQVALPLADLLGFFLTIPLMVQVFKGLKGELPVSRQPS